MTEGSSSNDDETYILDDQAEFFSSKSYPHFALELPI